VHLKSKLAVAEAARSAAEEQRNHLASESEKKDASYRTSRQDVLDLTARLEVALKQAVDAEKLLTTTREDHHKHCEALQASMDTERIEYQERIDGLTERLTERDDALRRALREAADVAARSETAIADARRAQQLETQEARRKYVSVSLAHLEGFLCSF
jgi:predicted O-linked N-acetylglucosamine transferase (SPINDLY family)